MVKALMGAWRGASNYWCAGGCPPARACAPTLLRVSQDCLPVALGAEVQAEQRHWSRGSTALVMRRRRERTARFLRQCRRAAQVHAGERASLTLQNFVRVSCWQATCENLALHRHTGSQASCIGAGRASLAVAVDCKISGCA